MLTSEGSAPRPVGGHPSAAGSVPRWTRPDLQRQSWSMTSLKKPLRGRSRAPAGSEAEPRGERFGSRPFGQVGSLLIALTLTSCGGGYAPASSQPVSPSPSLEPAVAQHLQLNNSRFELKPAPGNVAVSSDQAIAAARNGLTGTLVGGTARYGELHSPLLGLRSDRAAWLVVLEGVAPPAPRGAPAPVGPARTYAFIDAEDARGLMQFSEGAGPPQ